MKINMTRRCPITNKGTIVTGGYSTKTRASFFNRTGKHKKHPNLQKKRFYVPELDKHINLKVSTQGLKTIKKKGVYEALKDAEVI